jgi:hypothetical protein
VLTKAAHATSGRDADLFHDLRRSLGTNTRQALHKVVHEIASPRLNSPAASCSLKTRRALRTAVAFTSAAARCSSESSGVAMVIPFPYSLSADPRM